MNKHNVIIKKGVLCFMANIDERSLYCVLQLIDSTWSDVAYIDKDILMENLEMLSDGITSAGDRSIRKNVAHYLLDNYAMLYLTMCLSSDYRTMCKIAVDTAKEDMYLPYEDNDAAFRNKPEYPKYYICLSRYDKSMASSIIKRISDSMNKVEKYDQVMDYAMCNLSAEDKLIIGYCISNLFYLIKAFYISEAFVDDTKHCIGMATKFADEVLVEIEKAKLEKLNNEKEEDE